MTVVYIIVAVMSLSTAVKMIGDDDELRYGTEYLFLSEHFMSYDASNEVDGVARGVRISPVLMFEDESILNLSGLEGQFLSDIHWKTNVSDLVEITNDVASMLCLDDSLRDEYTRQSLDEMIKSPLSFYSDWATCIFTMRDNCTRAAAYAN